MHPEWTTIGTGFFCPAVVSLGSGGIALFARGASGDLICQQKGSAGWGVPASWGVPVAQTEGAEVTGPGRLAAGCQVLKRLPLAPVERLAWPCFVGVPDTTCC